MYSAIPSVSLEGVRDVYLAKGTVIGNRFSQFVKECLLPVCYPEVPVRLS